MSDETKSPTEERRQRTGAESGPDGGARKPVRKNRPRPAITLDNKFFWDGVEAGKLLIQRCDGCQKFRHPPGPMCPECHSMEWSAVEACGRGTVYSFVVAHYPAVPPFEYPNLIALVELEEGTRIISNLVGVDPGDARVGQSVVARIVEVEPDRKLLQFEPV